MIHVVGLGLNAKHPGPEAERIIREAALVGGGRRLLERLNIPVERRLSFTTTADFAARLKTAARACVVADGDPLLFGIGATLLRYFPAAELTFHPNVSAMQAACARFGLPWHDCRAVSLHGREDPAPLFAALTHANLVAAYTGPGSGPGEIARLALDRGVTGWRMHVAEVLGQPAERLATLSLDEAAGRTWQEPNMVLLERMASPSLPLCLGLQGAGLAHQDGLMTKLPVRATALSLLRLEPGGVLWDLGAGSGAVSLEAARLMTSGRIVSVERKPERFEDIRLNIVRTGAWMVEAVLDTVENFLDGASDQNPDRIFLGGGATSDVLERCRERLAPGGRLVATAVLLSTLDILRHGLERPGWDFAIHQLMHHVSAPLGGDLRLVPDNPVFLVEARKPEA